MVSFKHKQKINVKRNKYLQRKKKDSFYKKKINLANSFLSLER